MEANRTTRKPIAITMGEPAGVGPELIGKIWMDRDRLGLPPIIYVGDPQAIQIHNPDLPITEISVHDIDNFSIAQLADRLHCLPHILAHPIAVGTLDPRHSATVIQCIESAVTLVRSQACLAVVTAPIEKHSLYIAGFQFPGHTEFLAYLAGLQSDESVMMFAAKDLKTVPVTIHTPLSRVPLELTADRIYHATMTLCQALRDFFGVRHPQIAIAGLNPHAGEKGAIGIEEGTHIIPAIRSLKDAGVSASGPLPADTLFHEEARQRYDGVVCMYHDQALIPIKMLDFFGGVNVTLGLPFVRTSPDHGTALDIAGLGKARPDSMIAAIRMAAQMSEHDNG